MAVPPEVALAISTKKAKYGQFADLKQWDKYPQIALPDASFSFYDTDGSLLQFGNKSLTFASTILFMAFFSKFFERLDSLHNFGPGDFELINSDEVDVTWALEDQLFLKGTAGLVELRGGGFYFEKWVKREGEWWLKDLKMRRTYTKTSFLAKVLLLVLAVLGLSIA